MKVGQLMKQSVVTCGAQDSLNTVARLMWENDCGSIPVVDDEGHVVGMITDRDVCMAAYTQGKKLGDVSAESAMAHVVCKCAADDTLAEAQHIMRANQLHRLPVVDEGGRLTGILSLNDIAHGARDVAATKKRELTFAEVGETLEAICRPRGTHAIAVAA